jgi:hypothetical protein
MRLQLARARDTRRLITAALLTIGLLSQAVVAVAAKSAKTTKKTAAKKAVQPEKVYLEEEEDEEEPKPASQHEQGSKDTSTESGKSDASNDEKPAPPKSKARGAKVHASLETTAYTDTDAVNVLSPTVSVGAADDVAGWSFGGSYLVDVVTAASVDIVSTASPSWTEVRHVGALNGSAKWDPLTVGAVAVVSREPDYLSITGGGSLSIDLMEKNVTPYFAFSFEKDSVGRTELPHEYWKDKQVTNFQVGLTVVLGRASIGSVQWDGSFERGYLAKPYRYVPLFAPGQGASIPAGASIDEVNRLRLSLRAIEQLPGSRDRHAVSGHLAHRFDRSTLRLDERLYTDNWKLLASTSEVRYILDLGNRLQLWPHLRYHIQSAVSFWKRAYEALPGPGGLVAPTLRTGDRELRPLQTIILGAGMRWTLADGPSSRWDLILEADVGHTTYSDTLYITARNMGYTTLAFEAEF